MKSDRLGSILRTLLALVLVLILHVDLAHALERVALVIGNGRYQKVPALPNPTRDAADIAASLDRLGFVVDRLNDATAADMHKAIVEFGHKTIGSQMAIVFYAGHGIEVSGENWLIPVDAELRSDSDTESEAVSLRSLILQVAKASQLGLVILDACRDNPFASRMRLSRNTRGITKGLAPTEPSDNVLVAFAARDGTVANDGDGRNSPFTKALLANMETPGLEIGLLFRRVRDDVMSATHREQQPFIYGSLSKEAIYLKPPLEPPTGEPVHLQQPNSATALVAPPSAVVAAHEPAGASILDQLNTDDQGSNLFGPDDAQRVAALALDNAIKIPEFRIQQPVGDVPSTLHRFVGVWRGVFPSRVKAMLIISKVEKDGSIHGTWCWSSFPGVPTSFALIDGNVTGNTLKAQHPNGTIVATISNDGKLKTSYARRPNGISLTPTTLILEPVWNLALREAGDHGR
jgi:hypothetical protein